MLAYTYIDNGKFELIEKERPQLLNSTDAIVKVTMSSICTSDLHIKHGSVPKAEKGITVGAKIIMSLAGDIIPFMYKVTHENKTGEIPMPTDHEYFEDDIHLMAVLSENDKCYYKFINSVAALNIPTIGSQSAKDIYNYLTSVDTMTAEFFGEETKEIPYNILTVKPEEIYFALGGGRSAAKAKKSFIEILENLTLNDVVKSCNFHFCGGKVTEQVVNYLLTGEADWSHLATEGYVWVFDKNSAQYKELVSILNSLGKTPFVLGFILFTRITYLILR